MLMHDDDIGCSRHSALATCIVSIEKMTPAISGSACCFKMRASAMAYGKNTSERTKITSAKLFAADSYIEHLRRRRCMICRAGRTGTLAAHARHTLIAICLGAQHEDGRSARAISPRHRLTAMRAAARSPHASRHGRDDARSHCCD